MYKDGLSVGVNGPVMPPAQCEPRYTPNPSIEDD